MTFSYCNFNKALIQSPVTALERRMMFIIYHYDDVDKP